MKAKAAQLRKLSPEAHAEIKRKYSSKVPVRQLAKEYGVSTGIIYNAIKRKV